MPAYEVLRPLTRLFYAQRLRAGLGGTTPRDEPVSRTGSPSADRVLPLGNGPVHGWGVPVHDQALTGRLAAALRAATGRPTDVDTIAEEVLSAATAISWLGARDLKDYDLVMVSLGLSDAIRLTPETEWRQSLALLAGYLRGRVRNRVPILITGVPPVRSVPRWDNAIGSVAERHARHLNAATRQVAAANGLHYLDLPALTYELGRPEGSRATYAALAATLADRCAALIDGSFVDISRVPVRPDEWSWAGTAGTLAAARGDGLPEIERLQAEARRTFGVNLALVTLLEGDRQLFPTGGGSIPMSVPRELTYCDVVAEQDAPLVVPNRMRDERFRDNPYLEVSHTPFYAGQPLHGLDGRVIGTFCIFGAMPRSAASVSMDVLKDFAEAAESELHRIEAGLRTTSDKVRV